VHAASATMSPEGFNQRLLRVVRASVDRKKSLAREEAEVGD
jgi:hypothetical protein